MSQRDDEYEYEEAGTGFLDEVDEADYEDEEDLVEEDEDLEEDVVDEEPGPSDIDRREAEEQDDRYSEPLDVELEDE
jgi:hypothetical protein